LFTHCLSISTNLLPFSILACVCLSKSEENCINAANSLKVASSSLSFQATFFIIFVCAVPQTLDTDKPTFIAGLIPELKRSASRNI